MLQCEFISLYIALIHPVGYVRYQRTFYYYYKIISFVNFYSHECNLQLENVFAIVGGGGALCQNLGIKWVVKANFQSFTHVELKLATKI